LLVFLPGIGDCADDFEEKGLLRLVRQTAWPVDIITVDAHYGYYADRTILEQLHQDIFAPARRKGYRHIWLVGISLGGFGALLYASRYPDNLTGVVALAPFLGERPVIREIMTAGGLIKWPEVNAADDVRLLWRWLRRHSTGKQLLPLVYLGFGQKDIFAEAHRLLAAALPEKQVLIAQGGHHWSVWQQLWQEFLERKIYARQ
jgi:pimeloyl-ACP methyl ester carboxylesterase